MKSKGHLMTVLLILFSINIQAQISEEIKSYVDSTETLVNSGRKMLVQSIAAGDLDKTKDISTIYRIKLTATIIRLSTLQKICTSTYWLVTGTELNDKCKTIPKM